MFKRYAILLGVVSVLLLTLATWHRFAITELDPSVKTLLKTVTDEGMEKSTDSKGPGWNIVGISLRVSDVLEHHMENQAVIELAKIIEQRIGSTDPKDVIVCWRSMFALRMLGPSARKAIPALQKLLQDWERRGNSHFANWIIFTYADITKTLAAYIKEIETGNTIPGRL